MKLGVGGYVRDLADGVGRAWNRFWFTPSQPQTLALLRVLTGLVVLYTLATYTPDLDRFFGPDGWLPVGAVRQLQTGSWRFSYLDYLQNPTALRLAHFAAMGVAAAMVLGLFARLTVALTFVVVLSYLQRAPMLTSEFEPILAMVLAYLAIGPCGACYSVDAWRTRRRAQGAVAIIGPRWSATVATRLLQVHLTLVYVMMAAGKLTAHYYMPEEPERRQEAVEMYPWWQGEAVGWLLAQPHGPLVNLDGLRGRTIVVNAWTHAIVAFELAFPLLVWVRLLRPLMLALSAVMWAALAVLTGLVSFALMMFIAGLAFVPPEVVRGWLDRRAESSP